MKRRKFLEFVVSERLSYNIPVDAIRLVKKSYETGSAKTLYRVKVVTIHGDDASTGFPTPELQDEFYKNLMAQL